MVTAIESVLREQLFDRRHKLEVATNGYQDNGEVARLLKEVDAALGRMEEGSYGLCDVCHDPVETERLIANPLARLCLDHLTPSEQRALEDDLALAAQIQSGLLPQPNLRANGWEVAFHYQPAGLVSGDYCDLIDSGDDNLHFVMGDVSGKGVAASMLMANLQAMFRTLISTKLPLDQMLERASRVFCESTLPTHYATLACGRASSSGEVEICNAGHLPPLLVHQGTVQNIEATGLPVGIFCSEQFSVNRFQMEKGDTLFLYTDGFTETLDRSGHEYGAERLSRLLSENDALQCKDLIETCLRDLHVFGGGYPASDDLTLMSIQRVN